MSTVASPIYDIPSWPETMGRHCSGYHDSTRGRQAVASLVKGVASGLHVIRRPLVES